MSWIVEEKNLQQEKTVDFGNKFLIGNGYLGYRGTMEEYGKKEFTACTLSGIYDQQGTAWREPINAPNGLYTELLIDGEAYDLLSHKVKAHNQQLDIHRAVHLRDSVIGGKKGELHIAGERFASAADYHLLAMNYSFSFSQSVEIQLITGIDGDVWDINGPHLFDYTYHKEGTTLAVEALTGELHHQVVTAETTVMDFDGRQEIVERDKGIFQKISFSAEAGKTYTISKAMVVYTSEDVENPLQLAIEESRSAIERGYETLKEEHVEIWSDYWEAADVEIEGDDEAQFALRYSIYHLLSIAPRHAQAASIPARGLSGQTYKGAVFWDTEMFMLPFFLYTNPEVGKTLVNYRIKTLDGARKKAADYGFRGAFYAWESQENGQDACSDYNVTDVFTNRPMRTYFKDKQIHISADVAYGIWQTYLLTGDRSLLTDGGAEVILECARFYQSFAYYKEEKERFELIDVIGPDEYHERVYNNAYTNKMAAYTIETTLEVLELLKKEEQDFYKQLIEKMAYQQDLEVIAGMKENLYIPEPDLETGVIEQFDGYFNLEDTTVDEVRSRLIDPKEYWGGAYGVASDTQIIKQADVVLLLNLFKEEYSLKTKKANWSYYEPRTEHGSSLSACIYAMQACDIGDPEWAYPYFMKTASVDLTGESKQFAGTIYIGGTHPAANGGAWMTAVLGFGGLKVTEDGITADPVLPEKWQKLSFKLFVKGQQYKVDLTKEESTITKLTNRH